MIFKMFLRVDLKLSTLLFFCFVFVSFWTHVLCFSCNIETWQSLSVGWAWLSDSFSRLSPNLCCLFQALSIEMYFTAEYLQRKHDLTWLDLTYSLHSPLIGYATLSQNAQSFHDDTISNGFSSEVIWIFCNHRNKKLKQLSLPTTSNLHTYSLISAALLLCRGRRKVTVLPSTNSSKCSTVWKQEHDRGPKIRLSFAHWQSRAYARGVGVKKPLSLIFYKNVITCAKEINCFRILFACYFVDLMQIPRNKFACKIQGTLQMG